MGIGGGPNPITAEAARKALNREGEMAAQAHDASIEQAELDKAELREVERAEFYPEQREVRRPSLLRSVLDRLFRRSG